MPFDDIETTVVPGLSRYLWAHPLACDTCEGMARWWIADADLPVRDVQAAADWMLARGLLERLPAADGRVRYRRAALDDDARALLRRLARADD